MNTYGDIKKKVNRGNFPNIPYQCFCGYDCDSGSGGDCSDCGGCVHSDAHKQEDKGGWRSEGKEEQQHGEKGGKEDCVEESEGLMGVC